MLGVERFECIDFGAGTLKWAEFEAEAGGGICLKAFSLVPLGTWEFQGPVRHEALAQKLAKLCQGHTVGTRRTNACLPAFQTFCKVVKLPPVEGGKFKAVLEYEARHQIPFRLEEAVWDYQILRRTPDGESETLLAAANTEAAETILRLAQGANRRLDVLDTSLAALGNALRFNYGDLEGCTMLVDLGAKTSNVVFMESGRLFFRTINIGSTSITREFAGEAKTTLAEAERYKTSEGWVSLGGAFEEPEDEKRALVGKVARQVMTRLHIQLVQTIQFYRAHEGGTPPERILLAGGGAGLEWTARFFQEKLELPVALFNPLRKVRVEESLDVKALAKATHCLGEIVGLALRRAARCPVEVNLMPKAALKEQSLIEKRPYFLAAVASLTIALLAVGWFFDHAAAAKQRVLQERTPQFLHAKYRAALLSDILAKGKQHRAAADQLADWLAGRFTWADVLREFRGALERAEAAAHRSGFRAGVWIEAMQAEGIETEESQASDEEVRPFFNIPAEMARRYGITNWVSTVRAQPPPAITATNEISVIHLTCRAVSREKLSPTADAELAYALEQALQLSPLAAVGTNGTRLSGMMEADAKTGTFKFDVRFKLKRPVRL